MISHAHLLSLSRSRCRILYVSKERSALQWKNDCVRVYMYAYCMYMYEIENKRAAYAYYALTPKLWAWLFVCVLVGVQREYHFQPPATTCLITHCGYQLRRSIYDYYLCLIMIVLLKEDSTYWNAHDRDYMDICCAWRSWLQRYLSVVSRQSNGWLVSSV